MAGSRFPESMARLKDVLKDGRANMGWVTITVRVGDITQYRENLEPAAVAPRT